MFYDIFERLCNDRGITPTQAGRDNGIKQQTVAAWKKQGSTPNAATVSKLAAYFGVTVDYLLTGEEPTDADFPKYFFARNGYGMYAFHTEEERDKARDALEEAISQMNGKQRKEVLRYAQYLLDKDTPASTGKDGKP